MPSTSRSRGPIAELLRGARQTIDSISAEATYDGSVPSDGELARLRDRLSTLVDRGRADEVLLLCQRLLRHANRAVEAMQETDDDFLEGMRGVLEIVAEALQRSSKGPVEQMLWLHELTLS